MKNGIVASIACLFVSACVEAPTAPRTLAGGGPSLAATTLTTNNQFPTAILSFVPCANGGVGELILVSGTLHVLNHVTISNSNNFQVKMHYQPQGIDGVGLTTGDKYQATGVTQSTLHINGPLPIVSTFVNNFRMIGQGRDNNFLVHQNLHLTINANGEVTVTSVNQNVTCR